jgi:hypothetical protein
VKRHQGWQQVLFSSPVAITAGTTYIAAFFSSAGNYTSTTNYFTTSVVDGPITALADWNKMAPMGFINIQPHPHSLPHIPKSNY